MKKILAIFIMFSVLLTSCSSVKTRKVNVKKINTDKFTVEQKKKLEDLNYLCNKLQQSRKEDMYKKVSKDQFDIEKNKVIEKIPKLSDADFYIEVRHLMSLLKDNTIWVVPAEKYRNSTYSSPFVINYISGSYYVVAAYDEKYLGYKVDAINGVDIKTVLEKLKYIMSYENKQSMQRRFTAYLYDLEALKHMKIIDDLKKVTYTFEKEGKKQDFVIDSIVSSQITDDKTLIPIKRKTNNTIYKNYSSEFVNKDNYYIRFFDGLTDENTTIDDYAQRISNDYKANKFKKIIVDLREFNNTIPNTERKTSKEFLAIIKEIQQIKKRGVKVYVLISDETGGDIMKTCMQLKRYTDCIFVGEPTFSNVNTFASADAQIMLPNSKVVVYFSTKFEENDPSNKGDALYPDVNISYTFDDYMNVNDKVKDWVIKQ